MGLPTWAKRKLEDNWPTSLSKAIMKAKGFLDVGRGKKSRFKKDNKFLHKKPCHEGEWNQGQGTSRGGKAQTISRLKVQAQTKFCEKGGSFKVSQPKGDVGGKPKGACFNYNEAGHYSKDCPKSKLGNGGFMGKLPSTPT
jgi:hypothetical protein